MITATGSRGIVQKRCGKITRACRKTPEIAGTWKQYSDWKLFGFFPMDSCQLPVLSDRNQPEIIGKNPKIFRPQYCFHKSPELPGTCSFRTGLFDLGKDV
jgi:hypothetical protein